MKTSLYVEDGVMQIVLTPETEWEKNVLRGLPGGSNFGYVENKQPVAATVARGSFYQCIGGWDCKGNSDDSLIVRITPEGHANG